MSPQNVRLNVSGSPSERRCGRPTASSPTSTPSSLPPLSSSSASWVLSSSSCLGGKWSVARIEKIVCRYILLHNFWRNACRVKLCELRKSLCFRRFHFSGEGAGIAGVALSRDWCFKSLMSWEKEVKSACLSLPYFLDGILNSIKSLHKNIMDWEEFHGLI